MPSLLAITVSEKSLIEEQARLISLINVLDILNINTSEPVSLDATAPVNWSIYTLLQNAPEEIGRSYVQRLRLISPDGQQLPAYDIVMTPDNIVKSHIINFTYMPIGQSGTYFFELSVRFEDEDEDTWRVLARYPITINHNVFTANQEDPEAASPESDVTT